MQLQVLEGADNKASDERVEQFRQHQLESLNGYLCGEFDSSSSQSVAGIPRTQLADQRYVDCFGGWNRITAYNCPVWKTRVIWVGMLFRVDDYIVARGLLGMSPAAYMASLKTGAIPRVAVHGRSLPETRRGEKTLQASIISHTAPAPFEFALHLHH